MSFVLFLVLLSLLPYTTQAWSLQRLKHSTKSCHRCPTSTTRLFANNNNNNNNNHQKSKFSQPAFAQAAHHQDQKQQQKQPKQQTNKNKRIRSADSKIGQLHQERIQTAGRVGTKRFVDPCKVFIGNLPFDADRKAVQTWICHQMGLPSAILLRDVKVVTDWKTGRSKGYAFLDFTEPIYATVCMDKCHNQDFAGRAVSVNQGQKKPDENQLYIQNKKKKQQQQQQLSAEEAAIQAGLDEAEDDDDDDEILLMDPEEYALLQRLDPDLVETTTFEYNVDDELLEEQDDDDDDGVDGFWYGDEEDEAEIVEFDDDGFTKPMNREQRREAARRTKRRKLPHKGFGEPPHAS